MKVGKENLDAILQKRMTWDELAARIAAWRAAGETVGFTNGCFDIVHVGHVYSIFEAAKYADRLVVALNSDGSVRDIKGPTRPINTERDRAVVIASMACVDAVVIFPQPDPAELLRLVRPDVYVKGGDYTIDRLPGAQYAGRVEFTPLIDGHSTTALVDKM